MVLLCLYNRSLYVKKKKLLELCRISEYPFCGSRVDTREQTDGHTGQT